MYEPQKRKRHPKYRTSYRVHNWPEYEKSLRDRGDITIWVSKEAIDTWTPPPTGKRGGQPLYSDIAIETALALRLIFHQPLRQTEGFLGSVLRLMGLNLPCPDHTTLSRRNQTVGVYRRIENMPAGPIDFIVDSTGLKICGQGEWHAKKHGKKQRRHWRKLHLGVDSQGWVHAFKITDDTEQDPSQVPDLLGQVNRKIKDFVADGIYDQDPVYKVVKSHSPGAGIIIPPRKCAAVSSREKTAPSQRDLHIQRTRKIGHSKWRKESGYYQQSHAENAFSRYKATFGGWLRAKNIAAREKETELGCTILNRMRQMGRPISCPVSRMDAITRDPGCLRRTMQQRHSLPKSYSARGYPALHIG